MHDSTIRKRRLREKRRREGWEQFELWLPPETAGLYAELKAPGEALHETVERAFRALQAQVAQGPTPMVGGTLSLAQYKAAMLPRLRAMQAQGLSMQGIADRLYAEGIPSPTGNKRWHKAVIAAWLKEAP
jgi:hypothetical protein